MLAHLTAQFKFPNTLSHPDQDTTYWLTWLSIDHHLLDKSSDLFCCVFAFLCRITSELFILVNHSLLLPVSEYITNRITSCVFWCVWFVWLTILHSAVIYFASIIRDVFESEQIWREATEGDRETAMSCRGNYTGSCSLGLSLYHALFNLGLLVTYKLSREACNETGWSYKLKKTEAIFTKGL